MRLLDLGTQVYYTAGPDSNDQLYFFDPHACSVAIGILHLVIVFV